MNPFKMNFEPIQKIYDKLYAIKIDKERVKAKLNDCETAMDNLSIYLMSYGLNTFRPIEPKTFENIFYLQGWDPNPNIKSLRNEALHELISVQKNKKEPFEFIHSFLKYKTFKRKWAFFKKCLSFNQGRAKPTYMPNELGRFYTSNPNIQSWSNADRPTELDIILPFAGCNDFISMDYSQIDFAILADLCGAKDLIKRLNEGEDFHLLTADKLGIDRRTSKIVNFGILYGMGVPTLSRQLGCIDNQSEAYMRDIKGLFGKGLKQFDGKNLAHIVQKEVNKILNKAVIAYGDYYEQDDFESSLRLAFTIHDNFVFYAYELTDIPLMVEKMTSKEIYSPLAGLKLRVNAKKSGPHYTENEKEIKL